MQGWRKSTEVSVHIGVHCTCVQHCLFVDSSVYGVAASSLVSLKLFFIAEWHHHSDLSTAMCGRCIICYCTDCECATLLCINEDVLMYA